MSSTSSPCISPCSRSCSTICSKPMHRHLVPSFSIWSQHGFRCSSSCSWFRRSAWPNSSSSRSIKYCSQWVSFSLFICILHFCCFELSSMISLVALMMVRWASVISTRAAKRAATTASAIVLRLWMTVWWWWRVLMRGFRDCMRWTCKQDGKCCHEILFANGICFGVIWKLGLCFNWKKSWNPKAKSGPTNPQYVVMVLVSGSTIGLERRKIRRVTKKIRMAQHYWN